MIGDQIVTSTFNNLAWYNAISMMNTIFLLLKLYFPVTLLNIWLEDMTMLFVFGLVITYINYKVMGESIQKEMGLHTNMLYVCILIFLATTIRSLILKTLTVACGGTIPPMIFLAAALLLTFCTCLFSMSLRSYISKYSKDEKADDIHDVLGEVLEAFNKYLFGWLVSQFWNKFIISVFEKQLGTDEAKLVYALTVTFLVALYGVYVFRVKVNATLDNYRKAIQEQVRKGMAKSVKSDGSHESFGAVFSKLLTKDNKTHLKIQ